MSDCVVMLHGAFCKNSVRDVHSLGLRAAKGWRPLVQVFQLCELLKMSHSCKKRQKYWVQA